MSRKNPKRKQVFLALLVAAAIVAANAALFSLASARKPSVSIDTTPTVFPSVVLGVPFAFTVTIGNPTGSPVTVHANLRADCPDGGRAIISGDATGNACTKPRETGSKVISPGGGSKTFSFVVTYTGAVGSYKWTIQAREIEEPEDDSD